MRVTQFIPVAALAVVLMLQTPRPAFADSKELTAIGTVQRDIYDLNQKLDQLKSGEEGKTGEILTLLKQLSEANTKLTAELHATQDKLAASQAEQAKNVTGPLSDLRQNTNDLSTRMEGVQSSLNTIRQQVNKMEKQGDESTRAIRAIYSAVNELPKTIPTPPAPAPSTEEAAQKAFAIAKADKLANKDAALDEFLSVTKTYPTSTYAAQALMEIGNMYAKAEGQSDLAVEAYSQLQERLGDNPYRVEAQFRKAEQLAKGGHVEEAMREYQNFAQQNPDDDLAALAKARATALKPAPAAKPAPPKAKGKRRPA